MNTPLQSGEAGPVAEFWSQLQNGRFVLQRSASSGAYIFPPRVIAPCSGTRDLEWVDASGKGTVYAVTTILRKPERGGDYAVVLVELEEGPRILSRIIDRDPSEIEIGMAVTAHTAVPDFGPYAGGEQPIVLFKAGGAS